nr:ABC transporter substrate-binding protein [Pseudophaeobacter arcticus]
MLGGVLDTFLGWRSIFAFYAASGLGLLVLCWQDLGETKLTTFFRVTLPLAVPGVVAACLIVFIPTIGDYVTPKAISFDPEKAKALLAEAGLPDGFETTLHLPPPSYARRGGEIIAAQLAQVGIKAEIINVEWAQWLETVFRGKDFGLTIVSHTEPMDIGIYARPDYYFQYDNAAFQELMTTLNGTTDPDQRMAMLQQAQETIANDYVNGYLFQMASLSVAKAGLQGLWANAPTQAIDLTAVSWAD